MISFGFSSANCMHISAPIEPPAPVTRTIFPLISPSRSFLSASLENLIIFRPMSLYNDMSATCPIIGTPLINLSKPGSTPTLTFDFFTIFVMFIISL